MNGDALRLKNKKQKLWKKYVSSRSSNVYAKFVKCKKHLRSLTRNLRKTLRKHCQARVKPVRNPFGLM